MLDDQVNWLVEPEQKTDGPLSFFEAMWSLFSRDGEFYRMLETQVPPRVRGHVPANIALVAALQDIFAELLPRRDRLVRNVLEDLRAQGVPAELLIPEQVAIDWGHSQLNGHGRLTLRLEAELRRAPNRAEAETAMAVHWRFDPPAGLCVV